MSAHATLRPGAPHVSFEFFPPKNEAMEARLWDSINRLQPLGPAFVSVTYGAGGSTRERTHRTVKRIVEETDLLPAAHLTCVSATRAEIDDVIRSYWDAGVRHIVSLRGDPPEGIGERYIPHPGGYENAADLSAGIRAIADFEISVGCYPEKHPESASLQADIDHLKRKIDNGATRAISQFFFDADVFLRYLETVRAAGITIPIVPGIMLQPNFKGLKRMAKLCGASIPERLETVFDGMDEDEKTRELITAHIAADLCDALKAGGVDQFHFYTLNRAELALAACALLGVKPEPAEAA
ncbi:methylenetetrahydrofolate reductase [NAD(P)H] [Alkalicaulis satelles]|uniref:Methylenetetrahydrofolate reductase n=1 Tax=Alkalicaulis satelles TaxID=2609175 RepID=A0A5M6ZP05_9PROT|nr:methylenetetrahydrofolate reductase [NAD(P)H] [Alkalicaulis satelles]KAA5805304.1 methylenetetrahydrofolate reductase [NAD(P)H] [Alkalicaulis satelles]